MNKLEQDYEKLHEEYLKLYVKKAKKESMAMYGFLLVFIIGLFVMASEVHFLFKILYLIFFLFIANCVNKFYKLF